MSTAESLYREHLAALGQHWVAYLAEYGLPLVLAAPSELALRQRAAAWEAAHPETRVLAGVALSGWRPEVEPALESPPPTLRGADADYDWSDEG